MRRKLLVLTSTVAAATVVLAGTAGAAPAGQGNVLSKTSDTCSITYIATPHWQRYFNPGDLQRDWRTDQCGTPTAVSAGLYP